MGLASAAFAQIHNEVGDAAELLPGQATAGVGALTTINGSFLSATDVDLYAIAITDEANFSATTVNAATLADTQLWLFNSAGNGVAFNDDDPPPGTTLQSRLSSLFVTSNGTYYLGVSRYDRDAQAGGLDMWVDTPFNVERAPDGPGAGGVLSGWAGTGFSTLNPIYQINLTGASFIPEPTAALTLLPLGLMALRRRRA
jgi:hypothetical protein